LLATSAAVLVVATKGSVEHLVAFYALGVFTGFTLTGFGMARKAIKGKDKGWRKRYVINLISGVVSFVIVIIFAVVKFTEGAWIIIVITPILVVTLLRLNRQYRQEQQALRVTQTEAKATSITRHDVTVLVDSVDIATVSTVRYARSLKPRNINAVHFVIDDRRAEQIRDAWAENEALSDVSLELIDCPDRRIANAAVDYAIKSTVAPDVELTLLLPRRTYSKFLGRVLHDQTAEAIAAPISQLQRVVATIVPFDVQKIISGEGVLTTESHDEVFEPIKPIRAQSAFVKEESKTSTSHYSEDLLPIGKITWRKRAHVEGRVTSIKSSATGASPVVSVEIWDESGGVTLQFLGRREITGLEVGSQVRAEGMVGEDNGNLIILNPSYEIVI
jgi:hypothetical protein